MKNVQMKDDTWFRWSLILGIRPVHPKGWIALGAYLLAVVVTGPITLGQLSEAPLIRLAGAFCFLTASVIFFWKVLEHLK